jgi:hypothetical protein
MGFDLAKNNLADAAEVGYEFEVTLPGTGEPIGAFIKVRGEESKIVKAFGRKKYSEWQIRSQQAKRRGKEADDYTLEEAEEMAIESATVRVIDWRGFEMNGKPFEFSKENAQVLFKENGWIREQVMEESAQLLNFRPK